MLRVESVVKVRVGGRPRSRDTRVEDGEEMIVGVWTRRSGSSRRRP